MIYTESVYNASFAKEAWWFEKRNVSLFSITPNPLLPEPRAIRQDDGGSDIRRG
jgi:hypothetical protein